MGKLIALLTDFGTEDIYVGVMKAVMRGICPDAEFIDISHAISPQNILEGAFALANSYRYFPTGTVFLVVVDPTVGSQRKPIIVETEHYHFIAPDNGVLSPTLKEIGDFQAAELNNPATRLQNSSYTFHGRDIFAPAAAHAANGVSLGEFGTIVSEIVELTQATFHYENNTIKGEIIHIDHFGNIISNIGRMTWQDKEHLLLKHGSTNLVLNAANTEISMGEFLLESVKNAYHQVAVGEFLAQIDSNGYLEIAINQGSAAAKLTVGLGDEICLSWR